MDDQQMRIALGAAILGVIKAIPWIRVCEKAGYYLSLSCHKAKIAGRQFFQRVR